jgi:predicted ABC-type ATPase
LTAPQLLKPVLWIIAGPNGSGKSSAYGMLAVESPKDTVWIINPDLLAKRIFEQERLGLTEANLEAVTRIEAWLYSSISAYQTVGVETVLSSPKYRRLVETALAHEFQINLIYVYLRSVEMNLERVKLRVKRGGHDVPEDKIRERRGRSFEQFIWFFEKADNAFVFDNSDAEPRLVASKSRTDLFMGEDILPELKAAIARNL